MGYRLYRGKLVVTKAHTFWKYPCLLSYLLRKFSAIVIWKSKMLTSNVVGSCGVGVASGSSRLGCSLAFQRFIDADVVGRIVPTVAIRMDGDVQPDRPVICEKAIGTTDDASPFFSDLDGDEPTASCTFYEFENPARRELLRIYCGSATRRLVLDGLRSTHFFFLQIVDIA